MGFLYAKKLSLCEAAFLGCFARESIRWSAFVAEWAAFFAAQAKPDENDRKPVLSPVTSLSAKS